MIISRKGMSLSTAIKFDKVTKESNIQEPINGFEYFEQDGKYFDRDRFIEGRAHIIITEMSDEVIAYEYKLSQDRIENAKINPKRVANSLEYCEADLSAYKLIYNYGLDNRDWNSLIAAVRKARDEYRNPVIREERISNWQQQLNELSGSLIRIQEQIRISEDRISKHESIVAINNRIEELNNKAERLNYFATKQRKIIYEEIEQLKQSISDKRKKIEPELDSIQAERQAIESKIASIEKEESFFIEVGQIFTKQIKN